MEHWTAPYFVILGVELVGFSVLFWVIFRHARRD